MTDDAETLEDLRSALLRLRFPVLIAGPLLGLYALFSVAAVAAQVYFAAQLTTSGIDLPQVALLMAGSVLALLGTGLDAAGAGLLLAAGVRGLQARVDPGHLLQMARLVKLFWWVALARMVSMGLGLCAQMVLPMALL